MTRPLIGVFNSKTQEETIREMNDEEFAQYLIDNAAWETKQVLEVTND
jgi:hypothetical protein